MNDDEKGRQEEIKREIERQRQIEEEAERRRRKLEEELERRKWQDKTEKGESGGGSDSDAR